MCSDIYSPLLLLLFMLHLQLQLLFMLHLQLHFLLD